MSFKKILFIAIISLGLFTFGGLLIIYSFMDIKLSSVDGKGELIETVKSSNEAYQAEIHMIYGNTPDKDQVRVSITDLTNSAEFNDTTVYWLYPAEDELPEINWTSETTLEIEDKEIDITDKKTHYNYQKDKDLN